MMDVRHRKKAKSQDGKSKSNGGTTKQNTKPNKPTFTFCCLSITVVVCLIQMLIIALIILPSPIKPLSFILPKPPTISNSLAMDNENSERLLANELVGPESMASYGDYIYTGTYDRGVIRINKDTLETYQLPPLGTPPCGLPELEHTCGRPLGLRIHNGFIYVMDAYLGLFKYDLLDISKPAVKLLGGVKFGNDLVIASNGLIYFTDSSKKWERRQFPHLVLESSLDGMLVQYNETSGEKKILSETLSFANGIELSHREDFVIVVETNRARLARYWLSGASKGFWDYLNPNLPGFPDNIRRSTRGTYWVGMASVRHTGFSLFDFLSEWPVVRSMLSKILTVNPDLAKTFLRKHGLIVEINNDGQIIRAIEDRSGMLVPNVSEVEETVDGSLYLGSYALPYLTKLTLAQFH